MSRPEPDALDRPESRRRIALRRLPVTLAVLAFVGGGAAGLAYVASGSGAHRFPARLVNDLGRTVEVGECEHDDCKKGGMLTAFTLGPGQRLGIGLRSDSALNPIMITTPESKRIGCFFLRYAKQPAQTPVLRLSSAPKC